MSQQELLGEKLEYQEPECSVIEDSMRVSVVCASNEGTENVDEIDGQW